MHPRPLDDYFEDMARDGDGSFAIAYALLQLAQAQRRTAGEIRDLGNADAATPMGAIEAFGIHIGKKLDDLTSAISERGT